MREAVDAGDAVAGFDDGADVDGGDGAAELLDLLLDDDGDFFWSYCHVGLSSRRRRLRCVSASVLRASLASYLGLCGVLFVVRGRCLRRKRCADGPAADFDGEPVSAGLGERRRGRRRAMLGVPLDARRPRMRLAVGRLRGRSICRRWRLPPGSWRSSSALPAGDGADVVRGLVGPEVHVAEELFQAPLRRRRRGRRSRSSGTASRSALKSGQASVEAREDVLLDSVRSSTARLRRGAA